MQIRVCELFSPYIFAVQYDGDDLDIYEQMVERLTNHKFLVDHFRRFSDHIDAEGEKIYGFPRSEAQEYARIAVKNMQDLEEALVQRCEDIDNGKETDFKELFEVHSKSDQRALPEGGGKSSQYDVDYLPVKCFGMKKPSLVRIYAIEISLTCYIIIYGGIKLADTSSHCPDYNVRGEVSNLEEELKSRILAVARFLKGLGILDLEGFNQYVEEDHSGEKNQ